MAHTVPALLRQRAVTFSKTIITIDGSQGEGGGQILRSALALSLITGRPFKLEKIRAGRDKPGLRQQHLVCVEAAAAMGGASVQGAALDSRRLEFHPGTLTPGEYTFPIGTAGSTSLVLQTVMPPLLLANGPSTVTVTGGTHNRSAPPFEYLDRVLAPQLRAMGLDAHVVLLRHGFFPAGGGVVQFLTAGRREALRPLDLTQRGPVNRLEAVSRSSRLPGHVAERELAVVRGRFPQCVVRAEQVADARCAGNVLFIVAECEAVTELFTGFGERGVPAEKVAEGAADEAAAWLEAGVPVGPHLADQLLLPMAVAEGGSFRTDSLTLHARTNMKIIQLFLDVDFDLEEDEGTTLVRCRRGT